VSALSARVATVGSGFHRGLTMSTTTQGRKTATERRSKTADSVQMLCLLVGFAMLVTGLPSTAGLVLTRSHNSPKFTLNICHPIQPADRLGAEAVMARSAPLSVRFDLVASEKAFSPVLTSVTRDFTRPDPPPPKPTA